MKARGTATDKLTDVIQALQLVRKTGLLTVQYDTGGFSEVGTIVFREGQIVDARVGQLRGSDALKKLVMWTRCYFLFEPGIGVPSPSVPQISASSSQSEGGYDQGRPEEFLFVELVPTRAQSVQSVLPDFQRLGLSRVHRQLFLLIDGKRSTRELARLTGRPLSEIQALLADLEGTGLIRQ